MLLKRVELFGFKSFPDKTIFKFEEGITCIVGPNGCGKSNVADAIRWVIGEQSAKALRGTQMQDVIFNGSAEVKPLSMAEVSLVLDNSQKIFSIDFSEVTVTRRLYRSGESEYLINKSKCRLKDISTLFMDTGLGVDSYSIIEQGRMDAVLNSSPEERRAVFEEAAGITKYKARRKEAIRKLEKTDQNLLRLTDIIDEVQKRKIALQRQASKAKRYKKLLDELRDYELFLSKNKYIDFTDKIKRVEFSINDMSLKEEVVIKDMAGIESNIEKKKFEILELDEQLKKISAQLNTASSNLQLHEKQRIFNIEKLQEIGHKENYINQELISINKKIEDIHNEIIKEKENAVVVKNQIKEDEEKIKQQDNLTLEINEKIKNKKIELRLGKFQYDFSLKEEEFSAIKQNQEETNKKITKQKLVLENKELEKQELDKKYSGLTQDLEKLITEISQANSDLSGKKTKYNMLVDIKNKYAPLEASFTFCKNGSNDPLLLKSGISAKVDVSSNLFMVENLDKARELFKNLGPGYNIVTLEGEFIDAFGEISGGAQIGLSTSDSKIKSLEDDIKKLNDMINQMENTRDDNKKLLHAAKDNISKHNLKIKEQEEIFNNYKREKSNFDFRLEHIQKEMNNINKEIDLLKGAHNIQYEKLDLKSLEEKRDEAQKNLTDCKIKISALKEKSNSLNAKIERMDYSIHEENGRIHKLKLDLEQSLVKRQDLIKENNEINEKCVGLKETKNKFEENYKQLDDKIRLMNDKNTMENAKLRELRSIYNGYQKELKALEINQKEYQMSIDTIEQKIQEQYQLNIKDFLNHVFENIEDTDIEKKIIDLRVNIQSMGAVNLVAIEEFSELEQRYEFLTKQNDDLKKAKESLMDVISKINIESRKKFREAFNQINENFKEIFNILFGGGRAELILLDEQNLLECGIEVIACPPGKRPQTIGLLSGGEKALTGIALLFSMFKVKPSPFCILDEIDAPLDDMNICRFAKMIDAFKTTTQFVVITHSKKTMEMADILYGITMEKPGLSRMISVNLKESAGV